MGQDQSGTRSLESFRIVDRICDLQSRIWKREALTYRRCAQPQIYSEVGTHEFQYILQNQILQNHWIVSLVMSTWVIVTPRHEKGYSVMVDPTRCISSSGLPISNPKYPWVGLKFISLEYQHESEPHTNLSFLKISLFSKSPSTEG